MNFGSSCCLGFPERLVQLLKNFKFLTSPNSVAYKLLLIKDTKCTSIFKKGLAITLSKVLDTYKYVKYYEYSKMWHIWSHLVWTSFGALT